MTLLYISGPFPIIQNKTKQKKRQVKLQVRCFFSIFAINYLIDRFTFLTNILFFHPIKNLARIVCNYIAAIRKASVKPRFGVSRFHDFWSAFPRANFMGFISSTTIRKYCDFVLSSRMYFRQRHIKDILEESVKPVNNGCTPQNCLELYFTVQKRSKLPVYDISLEYRINLFDFGVHR